MDIAIQVCPSDFQNINTGSGYDEYVNTQPLRVQEVGVQVQTGILLDSETHGLVNKCLDFKNRESDLLLEIELLNNKISVEKNHMKKN